MDMKKIITAFVALSVILTGQQAYAVQTKSADTSNTKTMVIIDTGVD